MIGCDPSKEESSAIRDVAGNACPVSPGTEALNRIATKWHGLSKRQPMRSFTFTAIAGGLLLAGFPGAAAFGQQTLPAPVWSPAKAAAYLDTRSTWWISWPR